MYIFNKKISRVLSRPGLFPDVQRMWSTMTSRRDGVDATVNICTRTGFTYMYCTCTCMCTLYKQLYIPAIRKDFSANSQIISNSMCYMQYFSADELHELASNMNTVVLLSVGMGAIEQLSHVLPCSVVHTCTCIRSLHPY